MNDILATLEVIGQAAIEPFWLPMLLWTLLALPLLVALRLWSSAHPLIQYRARQALLFALPLGCITGTALALWPGTPSAVSLTTLPVAGEWAAGVTVGEAHGESAPAFNWTHGIGILTLIGLAGSIIGLSWLAAHIIAISRYARQNGRSPARSADRITKAVSARRRAVIEWSDAEIVPMTWGVLQPKIVLPRSLQRNTDQMRMALAHELVHIRRRDYLAGLLERCVTACFGIHPLVWIIQRSIDRYREQSCDAEVLRDPQIPVREYASLLVALAPLRSSSFPAIAMANRLTRDRIEAMKRYTRANKHVRNPWLSSALVAVLTLGLVGGMAGCSELSPLGHADSENAQELAAEGPPPPPSEVFTVVDHAPQLIGGLKSLLGEIGYPDAAREAGVEGRVFVEFVVTSTGEVMNVEAANLAHDVDVVGSQKLSRELIVVGYTEQRRKNPTGGLAIRDVADESASLEANSGAYGLLAEEAIRVVSSAQFEPGMQDAEPVNVRMSLPVTFSLK